MTSPIEEQQNRRWGDVGAARCALAPPGWACSLPAGHGQLCKASPVGGAPEPPSAPTPQPGPVPAAASSAPVYGFKKAAETDLELPSGAFVRVKKLRKMQVIDLKVIDLLDGFAPELLQDIRGDDHVRAEVAQQEAMRAMLDPKTSPTIFGPINRVAVAAVVCPRVVLHGQTTDEQINVNEIEPDDKMAIFEAVMPDELKSAALGEQLSALKSVRNESDGGVRDLRDGEAVLPEA